MTKIDGKLDKARCYLSGPMEFVADTGTAWRRKFIQLAKEAKLDIDIIDPTRKPGEDDESISENKNYQIKLQEEGRYIELAQYVANYRRLDLRFVDISDFMVCLVDPNVHMCGTYDEIFTAERQHKPSFFICDGGLKNLPRWMFDVVELDDPSKGTRCNVFESVEEVIEELVKINTGLLPMDREWVLINKYFV